MHRARSLVPFLVAVVGSLALAGTAQAFCGFYVAKADTKLFNQASKVVLVRDGDRTVLTMANDYEGEPSEFAMVVPVPAVLQREQIHVASPGILAHLDAYTAPRLVEYHDPNPCMQFEAFDTALPATSQRLLKSGAAESAGRLGVTIEAEYTVGEYDILILSAKESSGLVTWLMENDYRIPDGAEPIVASYLKQGLKFFVAKVNLGEHERIGASKLRPLQMAFETERFGLPIRLGTVNAKGTQDLFVYALTRTGRVETTNYRTVKLPSNVDVPPTIEDEFADFYRELFAEQTRKEGGTGVFLEYAWDMSWCDPCAADPLSFAELQELGVFWLERAPGFPAPLPRGRVAVMPAPADVFVTRLHVRYDADSFPDDLRFRTTGDRQNFQGRYVMRHPWEGSDECPAAAEYRKRLRERQEQEARTLADLTGRDLETIRAKLGLDRPVPEPADPEPWWRKIWPAIGRRG